MNNNASKLMRELKEYAISLYGKITPCFKPYRIYLGKLYFFFNDENESTHTTSADLSTGKVIPKHLNA